MGDVVKTSELLKQLAALRQAHRELDQRLLRLGEAPYHDQLLVQRLKREKLALRDRIARLESARHPDIIA